MTAPACVMADALSLSNLALNMVVFFAGIGAHATWLKVKARHGR